MTAEALYGDDQEAVLHLLTEEERQQFQTVADAERVGVLARCDG